ncbi:hypothetical protein MMAD_46200 [Mycolicibacterium madagascariense]|uniref:DUF3027 domain-containing protein n=2 Tax=Mycolicibacterium madagascariense TaxID=212765 RepID=A0A7I7XMC5_9MYCO|nr:DUF3027 domain-containing protein [Mycolicibacterium madagascariense]BBZ30325.1 hypothetical protein MMAD_46200 [Mycolicibacterium madagascariense]
MDSMIERTEQGSEELTAVLMGAVDAARTAILEFEGGAADRVVGEYLGGALEDPFAVTHRFLATIPGYQGWQWAVVVAAHPGADHATISEVVLVPGPTALLAPQWVPWQDRVQPGDLSPGDLLATPADDPRLVPGYLSTGDDDLDELAAEVGFGKRQVLSQWGRIEAAERWYDGDYGPGAAMARATRKVCRDCAYYLELAGSLGTLFGVCANEMSADGHVVAGEYGCGAHSDTPQPATIGSPQFDPFDDGVLDLTEMPREPEGEAVEAAGEPAEPAAEAEEPGAEAAEPAAETAEPAAETAEPAAETAEPAAETAEPAAETAEPAAEADPEPAAEADPEPTAEAVEPAAEADPEPVVET